MFIHEVICPPISGVIAHALNRSYCHGAPVYAMIDLQQIDLQLSSIHRSLPVAMSSIFVNVLFTKQVKCLRIKGVATSQRQQLVASTSTFPHDAQCLLRIESPVMTVGMSRQDCIVLRSIACMVNIPIFGV